MLTVNGTDEADVSISLTAAFLYGGCCVTFLLLVMFLFVCKIGIIDADPSNRNPSKNRTFRGRPKSVMSCWCCQSYDKYLTSVFIAMIADGGANNNKIF